ncbi:protein lin-37 homolog [Drosophila hydei]|uniref:Protein lin-37 homolog n=1 Tax=Drosophila hydei TaxID=7224 RepID=A0A6J1LR70_DROHY|nr:protein lin-37 homolog [Drosophila hydei]
MKVTPKKSRATAVEGTLRPRESRKEIAKDESEAPLPMLQMDDDMESELPIRGRPSKKLVLLQKQQQRAQSNAKQQSEVKSESAAEAEIEAETVTTPATATGSGRSKAKRSLYKKSGNHAAQKSHSETYVMRLFERSLDLSKYKDKTPLYPICRAWMANQPRNPSVSVYNTDGTVPIVKREDDAEEVLSKLLSGELKVVKQMPQARKTEMSLIPPRLPNTQDERLNGASKEELLAENVSHWKRVRSHWLKHAQKYERERYEIIDQIMDAVCKRE